MKGSTAREENKRLVVLVPGGMNNPTDLARKINQMAAGTYPGILYLMLVEDAGQALAVSRDMATMKAITAGDQLSVSTVQADDANWLDVLQAVCRPGDTLVCLEGHRIKTGLFRTAQVSAYLREIFSAPVEVVSGLYQPKPSGISGNLQAVTVWSGFLTVVSVFAWLEIQLGRSISGLPGKLLLLAVMFLVFGALWAWTNITF